MHRTSLKLLPILTALLSLAAGAEPVAESERIPLDLRRTTLIVTDIENSLALYRDALGMKVIYDNAIRSPRDAATDEEADRASRLVFLRANDDFVGILGLLEYTKPRRPQPLQLNPFQPGTVVLLFNTQDLEARFGAARAVNGVRVLSEPRDTRFPSYDGEGFIPVTVSVLQDPDGFTVELNQLKAGLR